MKDKNKKNDTNILAVQPIKTKNLADYQKGSIVSRTLVDKKTGTVTFFAFDKGQGLSEHIAPFDALVHIIDGEVEIMTSKKGYNLKNGEMIIIPANQPHTLKAVKRFKMILVMVRQ